MALPKGTFNDPHYSHLELRGVVPRLPIPALNDTLDKYLKCVQNLLTDEEFQKTRTHVEDFRKRDGPELHKLLMELDGQSHTSWLEGWWDSMYLEARDPLVITTNPFFILEDDPKNQSQVGRAAVLTYASLLFYKKVKLNQLKPDKERDTPLCMCQYGRIFSSMRIPGATRDQLQTYTQQQLHSNKHIVVLRKGQFYYFEVMDLQDNLLPVSEIQHNLTYIIEHTHQQQHYHKLHAPLGLLTSLDRSSFAGVFPILTGYDTINEQSMHILSTALFFVCLDDDAPATLQETSKLMLHSDGKNRWFDKCIQIIVTQNGKAGINFEHSGMDGHTVLNYTAFIHAESASLSSSPSSSPTSSTSLQHTVPKKLQWSIPNEVLKAIQTAESNLKQMVAQTDTFVLRFSEYGKKFAVSHKLSPDALVQMAYQLTFYKLYRKPGSTYESAMTKQFYHGRTECLRSCTSDSVAFTKIFANTNSTTQQKVQALRKAASTHVKLMNECKNGQGHDRHLYGMRWLAAHLVQKIPGYKMPAIYTDKAYSIMRTDLLSTSNCGNSALCLFGFGPTADEGFGLGYIIDENSVAVNITSYIGQSRRFAEELERSFQEIKKELLAEKAQAPQTTPAATAAASLAPRAKL